MKVYKESNVISNSINLNDVYMIYTSFRYEFDFKHNMIFTSIYMIVYIICVLLYIHIYVYMKMMVYINFSFERKSKNKQYMFCRF